MNAASFDYPLLFTAAGAHVLVALTALATLLFDVTVMRDREVMPRARVAGGISVVGLLGALCFLGWQWSVMNQSGIAVFYQDAAGVLVVDRLVLLLQALVIVLTIGTVLLSVGWEQTRHVGEQLCLVVFSSVGMLLLIATKNLLMFFVALETVSVSLYVLTAFHKGVRRSAEASVKYFVFGAVSSAFLLFGLAWIMGGTGAVEVKGIATALHIRPGAPMPIVWVGLVFALVGLGFKMAVAPFHFWAPDAYEGAPTPVAGFIATASKVASVVVALRLLLIAFGDLAGDISWPFADALSGQTDTASVSVGWAPLIAVLSVLSMVWGNFAAIGQRNVKRLLAYSSVAHAGYLLIGFVTNDQVGIAAVLFYLFAYSLTNLGAFGVISALTRTNGGDDVEDFDGLAQRSPLMALLLMVFFLSLAGVPPLAGFFGKLYLFYGAASAGGRDLGLLGIVAVALLTSAVSLYYYLTVLKHVFVHEPRSGAPVQVPWVWTGTLVLLALAVLALGVWPEPLLALLNSLLEQGAAFRL